MRQDVNHRERQTDTDTRETDRHRHERDTERDKERQSDTHIGIEIDECGYCAMEPVSLQSTESEYKILN